MNTEKTNRPFGLRDKLGYMFGDFGNDFMFIFAGLFLMVFYTKVLGISAELVGVLFLVARCVDAVTDVTVGRLVDKLKPGKHGRFRTWILRMSGPAALTSFLMYQSSLAGASMGVKIVYMFVTYLLWGSVCYTCVNIPYGSMASAITEDADERASLSTFRSLGAALAQLIIGVIAPLLIYTTDANGNQIVDGGRITIIAGVFSFAAFVCYMICYFTTFERVQFDNSETSDGNNESFFTTLKGLVTNKPLLGIIVAAILLLLVSLLTQSLNQYLFIDYFKNSNALSLMNFVGLLPSVIIFPLVVPISKKYGKKEASAVGCIIGGISSLVLYFLHLKNIAPFILISIVGYFGFGFFNMVIWAFITDIIDDNEVRTGHREDGTIYAVYSFARKLGQALAGGLGGFALGLIGYDSSVQVQTEAVANGIYDIATLIPGIAYILVGLVLIFLYPLNKTRVQYNVDCLKKKREGAGRA